MTPIQIQTFKAKAPKAMKDLMDMFGFGLEDVAAIMGNAGHESEGLTAFQERGVRTPGGWGWFQWTGVQEGGRRKLFMEFAKEKGLDPRSDEANYKFLVKELKGSKNTAVDNTKKANGLYNKVIAFELVFEVAGVKHYDRRLEWAKVALDAWNASGLSELPPPVEPKETSPAIAIMADEATLQASPDGELTLFTATAGTRVRILDDSTLPYWKVELVDMPGKPKPQGWVAAEAINRNADAAGQVYEALFAEECCDKALTFKVRAHYLMSAAQLRTKVTDGPNANGIDQGPFALSPEEWNHYGNLPEVAVVLPPEDIEDWRQQCLIFAVMTALTQRALAVLLGVEPTFTELYLAQIVGSKAAASALRDTTQTMESLISNISDADAASEGIARARIASRYPEFTSGTVQDAVAKIETELQKAMDVTRPFIVDAGGEVTSATGSAGSTDVGDMGGPVTLPPLGDDTKLAQIDQPIDLFDVSGDPVLASEVQTCLIRYGLLDPPVDGSFGGVSNWALSEFCSQKGINIGGGLSRKLARELLRASEHPIPITLGTNLASRIVKSMIGSGHWLNRHPKCLNIVYVEGMNVDGTANDNKPNRFNDCRCLLSIAANGKPRLADIWDGTTEPSIYFTEVKPMNPRGAARIAFGQYKAWSVGTYNKHEVLRQVSDIRVFRDLNKDYLRKGDKTDTGVFGIHHHWGYDYPKNDLSKSSAGCLVGRTRKGHREFMKLLKSDPRYSKAVNSYRFMATILPYGALPSP